MTTRPSRTLPAPPLKAARNPFALALSLALAASACLDVTNPLPEGAVRFEPPAIYALWWEQVAACSERSGSIASVEFFVVPGASSFVSNGRAAAGQFDPDQRRIVLAGAWQTHGGVVRHEMLHALLPTVSTHRREFFAERCWDVVTCEGSCVLEAGAPSIPAAAVSVPITDLIVEASVLPAAPAAATTDGRFMLILTARNPHAFPVRVTLAASLDPDPRPYGFGRRVETVPPLAVSFGTQRVLDIGASHFRAHEVRRVVYDYVVGSSFGGDTLPPGSYRFFGNFSGVPTTQAATFVIPP